MQGLKNLFHPPSSPLPLQFHPSASRRMRWELRSKGSTSGKQQGQPGSVLLCWATVLLNWPQYFPSSKITCLSDFRPAALTSVAIKAFKRSILSYLKSCTSPLMDPYHFVYQANRSVEDAVSTALQHALESQDIYTRILFIDFSSTFTNSINPHKVLDMNIDPVICHRIWSFHRGWRLIT